MEKANKKDNKNVWKVILIILFIICIAIYFMIYRPMVHYLDTHIWATVEITEKNVSDNTDVSEESIEFLKKDIYYLDNTTVTVKDITTGGTVTLAFKPKVYNFDTGEFIGKAVIDRENGITVYEKDGNMESVVWQFKVTDNRYQ